ncbi:HTH domain-containing protein, partial [Streptococcus gallolyticus]
MLLTKREEQLLKAFLEFGKLSIDNISDILKVSKRTVYRTIADLTDSLAILDVDIVKEENKYQLLGNLENLSDFTTQVAYTRNERLNLITYQLLISDEEVTNDDLQEQFAVSNVTIIQDIADIEKRLKDFDLILERKKGYFLSSPTHNKRRVLAILLTNNISLPNFWKHDYNHFTIVSSEQLKQATEVFQRYQKELPEFDAKLTQFFIILLALTNWGQVELRSTPVTKVSLEFSQKVFADFSRMS